MKITAAVATAPDTDFTIEQLTIAAPRPDEVLIEIRGVGLCHTDLIFRDQFRPYPLPAVLGHEGSGIVRQVGSDVHDLTPGDTVVLSFAHCGACRNCERHLPALCAHFEDLNYTGERPDGSLTVEGARGSFFGQSSFASMALAQRRNVVKVDSVLPIELLGPLGCGIQTGAGAVLHSFACEAGSSLLVTGGGSVGMAAIMAGAIRGCGTIILSEPVAARRALALELGATHVIAPTAEPSE